MSFRALFPECKLAITGPTGWLGSAAIAYALKYGVKPENLILFGSFARSISGPYGPLMVHDLMDMADHDLSGHLVLHLAFLTKDKTGAMPDADFVAGNIAIDDAAMAALQRTPPKGVFVASSGAAANPVEIYGQAKVAQEQRFLEWGQGAGVPVLAGRIFNVAGPHINKHELYALSSCIVQALQRGEIHIMAGMPVWRSYAHVSDVVAAVLGALLTHEVPDHVIDLAGGEHVEMEDVALAVAKHIPATITRGPVDPTRPNVYIGDPAPLQALCAHLGIILTPFEVQVADTVEYLRGIVSAPPVPAHPVA